MPTSRVPDAIDTLLQRCRAAADLDGVDVVDGPPYVDLTNPDRIHIGWSPTTETAASIVQNFAGAGARRRDEDFVITGYAEARSGDVDMQAVRSRVFDLVAVIETLLRATDDDPQAPTLGGAVQWAHLTAGDLTQPQTTDGALAGLTFSISCHARL